MSEVFDKYRAFSTTFCEAMLEMALVAKLKKDASVGGQNENFDTGYLCGFQRVFTLIEQQAGIFDIDMSELGLDNVKDTDFI